MRYIAITYLPALLVLLSAFIPGVSAVYAEEAEIHDEVIVVKIFNVAFDPQQITVKSGTTIRWVNLDPLDHDVTSGTAVTGRRARQIKKTRFPDGRFHSGPFGKGGGFEVTMKEKDVYNYYCSIHPVMQAVVIVE